MVEDEPAVGRLCREVRAHLPGYVSGDLPRWRRRLVGPHLRRCAGCQRELARQQQVAAALQEMGEAAADGVGPPPGLLDSLLERAEHTGVRERAAVPARGAVSGARPALSVALLVTGAATGTAVGFAAWRAVRAARAVASGRRRRS
jgi:anti-sigma factor RsiW